MISEEEYGVLLEQVSAFLQGKYDTLLKELKAEMEKCAEQMEYERAAIWRDRIRNVERGDPASESGGNQFVRTRCARHQALGG